MIFTFVAFHARQTDRLLVMSDDLLPLQSGYPLIKAETVSSRRATSIVLWMATCPLLRLEEPHRKQPQPYESRSQGPTDAVLILSLPDRLPFRQGELPDHGMASTSGIVSTEGVDNR